MFWLFIFLFFILSFSLFLKLTIVGEWESLLLSVTAVSQAPATPPQRVQIPVPSYHFTSLSLSSHVYKMEQTHCLSEDRTLIQR